MSAATSIPAAAPATLTSQLRALLAGFTGAAGSIFLDAWSAHGFAHRQLWLDPPVTALPTALLDFLQAGDWGLRIAPTTCHRDRTPAALAYITVTWPVALDFSAATDWRRQPNAAALAAISTALRGFALAPTFVVDGLQEYATLWALTAPLDLRREADRARAVRGDRGRRSGPDAWPAARG